MKEILQLLNKSEIEHYNKLLEQLKQVTNRIHTYHQDKNSMSIEEYEELEEQQEQLSTEVDKLQNLALSRLSADKGHFHDFVDDFTDIIIESAQADKTFSQQLADTVSKHYCKMYPNESDLYTNKDGETLTEYVNRISAALAAKDDNTNVKAKKTHKVEYPVDKLNAKLWGLLEHTAEKQIGLYVGSDKKGKEAIVTYSINFDGLNDVNINSHLTQFDKRIYVAVSALYNAGNKTISLTQVHTAMGYTSKPSGNVLEKINKSIQKMTTARIEIDNREEVEVYKNYPLFSYSGSLMPLETITATINGKLTDAAINVLREPPLVTYAKEHKQITTVDVKLLQSPLSKTESNLGLEDYILEQISHMKSKKDKIQNRMLFDTIYKRAGITDKKQKQRTPAKIKELLDYYKKQNWIKDYITDKTGIEIIC